MERGQKGREIKYRGGGERTKKREVTGKESLLIFRQKGRECLPVVASLPASFI